MNKRACLRGPRFKHRGHYKASACINRLIYVSKVIFLFLPFTHSASISTVSASKALSTVRGCQDGTLTAGERAREGAAALNEWKHYLIQLPEESQQLVQLRIELLQPRRRSFGAHLFVHAAPVDCSKVRDFHYEAKRPEQCSEGACEELEWVTIPDVQGPLHVAVRGGGGAFWLHASAAPFELVEVAGGAPAAADPLELRGSAPEPFPTWYRLPNTVDTPPNGLSRHSFGIQAVESGQAARLAVARVPLGQAGGPVAEAAGEAAAVGRSMSRWGWGTAEAFATATGPSSAAAFLIAVEVHASGINITRHGKFLPCSVSGVALSTARACGAGEPRGAFRLRVSAAPLPVPPVAAPRASEAEFGGAARTAQARGRAERGEWRFVRLSLPQVAERGVSLWDPGAISLVRITMRLLSEGMSELRALRTPRGEMRASALGFPLDQLSVPRYQVARSCRPNCALVVPVLPGQDNVSVAFRVDSSDIGGREYVIRATHLDMACGWLPTCEACADAAAAGRNCTWAPDEESATGGYCFASEGGGGNLPGAQCPSNRSTSSAEGASARCHVPGSIFGAVKGLCTECAPGCGWCGQPFGGGSHSGACVPQSLGEDTGWVGLGGPLSGDTHLMAGGFCSSWRPSMPPGNSGGLELCDELAADASAGSCDLGSADCALCGELSPVCGYCADPSDVSSGQCVPLGGEKGVCSIADPWLGFDSRSCPPGNPDGPATGELPTSAAAATQVSVPARHPEPAVAAGHVLIGEAGGLASNAVYLRHELGANPSARNLLMHVRAPVGVTLRAMARVGSLPVPSRSDSSALHKWGNATSWALPLGVLQPATGAVYLSLEQERPTGSAAMAEVWVDDKEGVLVANPAGGSRHSEVSLPVKGTVCCGAVALYELRVEYEPGAVRGGHATVTLESAGGAPVLLLASADRAPSLENSDFRAPIGSDPQVLQLYLGTEEKPEHLHRVWYLGVAAEGGAGGGVSYLLRAEHIPVGGVPPEGLDALSRRFPVWAWVLIAIAMGIGLGLVLLVFAFINKLAYKSLRQKMYAVGEASRASRSSSKFGGSELLQLHRASGWAEEAATRRPGVGAAAAGLVAFQGKAGRTAQRLREGAGSLWAAVGRRLAGGSGGGQGREERRGLLGRLLHGGAVYYNPKTFRQPTSDEEDEARTAEQGDSATAEPEPLLLPERDVEAPAPGEDSKANGRARKEGSGRGELAAAATPGAAGDEHPSSLMEGINSTLWRGSVGGSSVAGGAADAETPTSTAQTPGNSLGGMTVLNERIAVLARAEELEESRKPRPDSVNPVKTRAFRSAETDGKKKHSSGSSGGIRDRFRTPLGGLGAMLGLHSVAEDRTESIMSLDGGACTGRQAAAEEPPPTGSSAGKDDTGPAEPAVASPLQAFSPTTGRRRAPPPLSVTLESTEPTGDEILMLSEEEAKGLGRERPASAVRASNWTIDDRSAAAGEGAPLSPEAGGDDCVADADGAEGLAAPAADGGRDASAVEPFDERSPRGAAEPAAPDVPEGPSRSFADDAWGPDGDAGSDEDADAGSESEVIEL